MFDAARLRGHSRIEMNADPVREFYTSHPYPPPVANLDRARDEWQDAEPPSRRVPPAVARTGRTAPTSTSSSPDAARGRPPSTRSAGPTPASSASTSARPASNTREQLKRKYNLTNLETRQLPIEQRRCAGRAASI